MSRRGSWTGEMWAFVLTMTFIFGSLLVMTFFPIIFHASIDAVLLTLWRIATWLLEGWSGAILIWGFALSIWFMIIGGAVMAVQGVYRWIRSDGGGGSDSSGDKYRVDKELR